MKTIDQLFDWADITSDTQRRSKPLTERGGDVFLVFHHAYNRLVQDTIALSKPGGKTVTETGAMGPTVAGSDTIYNVLVVPWNTHRPYTTASSIDDKAITFEISNKSLLPPYPVAQNAKQRGAEVAAAMHVELGMPLDRWHVTSHQEVYARGWGSYATACPGGDLQGALDWIVEEAKRIVAGGSVPAVAKPKPRENTVAQRTPYERVYRDGEGKIQHDGEWMLAGPDMGVQQNDSQQDGYQVTDNWDIASRWILQYGTVNPDGRREAVKLERGGYIAQQDFARRDAREYRRTQTQLIRDALKEA